MKAKKQGYTLIELLIVLMILSLVIITMARLFGALLGLQQKISKTNQINAVVNQVINTIERDIRWATYIKITASGKKIYIETLDNNNFIQVEYRYDQVDNNIYQSLNGGPELPLIPDNSYVTEFEFKDQAQRPGEPGSRSLIITHLKMVSDLSNNDKTVVVVRDSVISNVNHDIELNAFFPIEGVNLSPTPTLMPYYSPTPTPTPTVYLPPYCGTGTSLSGGLQVSDFGNGSLSGNAQGDFNDLTLCGNKNGIHAGTPGFDNFYYLYQTSTDANMELTAKVTEWNPTTSNSRIGIMIRHGNSIQAGTPFASFSAKNNNTFSIQFRKNNNGQSYENFNPWPVQLPFWLKIIKTKDLVGNSYQMYLSYNSVTGAYTDGTWARLDSVSNVSDTTETTYGVYVTSSSESALSSARVTNVSLNLTSGALPTPQPTPTPLANWTPPPPTNTPTPGAPSTPTPSSGIPTYTPTPTTTPGIIPD